MKKHLLSLILLGTCANGFASAAPTDADTIAEPMRKAAPVAPFVDDDVAALKCLGLSETAATFVAALEHATVGAEFTGLPAVDFSDEVASATTAASYGPAMTALASAPGFSTLKDGNKAYFVAALDAMLAAKADITMAIAESAQSGTLTAAYHGLAGDIGLIPQADAKAAPAKILANLFEKFYNASGVTNPSPIAAGFLDTVALPAFVKAELEKEATWNAILAAVK